MSDEAHLRLLLVEDNPADARLLEEMLGSDPQYAFDIVWEKSLDAGVQRLTAESFDAMLLDLSLPDSQGIESVATAHLFDTETPIIVITGLDDDAAAFEALRAGAQDYLVKGSIDARQLIRTVRFARQRVEVQNRLAEQRGAAKHEAPLEAAVHALACPGGAALTPALARYATSLHADGRDIVFLASDRPASVMLRHLRDEGVDVERMHFIDGSGQDSGDDGRIFVPEDARDLDALSIEVERACAALGATAHVIVDSINSLILHHGVDAAAVFSHTLANRLRLLRIPADFVGHHNQEWPFILDRFSFLDGELNIEVAVAEDRGDPSFA